jgi:peptidoglycan/xylan/chitin deacetylase (PgdA/CDA1 family)
MAEYLQRSAEPGKRRDHMALTFDDGTGITYEVAAPIMARRNIPATFFVSTCQVDSGPLIWGGYLNALCFEEQYTEIEHHGEKLALRSEADRRAARTALTRLAVESGDPRKFAEELSRRLPISEDIFRYYRGMTSRQIQEAASNPLFDIGAHSVHHYALSRLGHDKMASEVMESGQVLERITGKKTEYFAYPSGDYDMNTIECLKECGYSAGFAVRSRRLAEDTDYEIPRMGAYGTPRLLAKMWLYRMGFAYQDYAI